MRIAQSHTSSCDLASWNYTMRSSCNNQVGKIHVKYKRPRLMGHIFQVEWWEKHLSQCSFGLLWIRKLENAMEKALKRHEALFGIFIYENNGK